MGDINKSRGKDDKDRKHIFISYKHEELSASVMTAIKDQLKERGYNVWMDTEQMSKG